jgi:hypothetical protein
MDQESIIKKALKALSTKEFRTIASAARKYGVSYTTLHDRYQGCSTTRQRAQEPRMRLNIAQERAVVRWIGGLTAKGFPPTYTLLRARIKAIKHTENPDAPPLGKNYITKFIKRHPELGAAISNRRDKKRAIVSCKAVYQDFFNKVVR